MAPPKTSRPLKKDLFASTFKGIKTTVLAETGRPSGLAPNIRSLSWSPTGSLIATSISSYIRVWNPERPNVKSSTELRAGGTAMASRKSRNRIPSYHFAGETRYERMSPDSSPS